MIHNVAISWGDNCYVNGYYKLVLVYKNNILFLYFCLLNLLATVAGFQGLAGH